MLRPLVSRPGCGLVAARRPLAAPLPRVRRAPAPKLRAAQLDGEQGRGAGRDRHAASPSAFPYEVAIVRLQSILSDAR
jgi:hypothetical protein